MTYSNHTTSYPHGSCDSCEGFKINVECQTCGALPCRDNGECGEVKPTSEYKPDLVKVIKTNRPTFYIDRNVYPDVWLSALKVLRVSNNDFSSAGVHIYDAEGFKLGRNNRRTGERLDPPTTT